MDERERCYTRIKRGMVFWYNIDASVNKFDVPDIKVSEKRSFRDYLEYGDRPWLLISVDEKNIQSKTCTIIPLSTTQVENDKDKFHVGIKFKGKDAVILCEHLRTVNCSELIKYDCTLEPNVMARVENALKEYLGISDDNPLRGIASDEVVEKLEDIINDIVKKKVEEERSKLVKCLNVDDAVLRIGEGIETLFEIEKDSNVKVAEVKSEEMNIATEKVEKVKEETKEEVAEVKEVEVHAKKSSTVRIKDKEYHKSRNTKTTMNRWDRSSAIAFIQEVSIIGAEGAAQKYGYANDKSVLKTIKYLETKYDI